ncbi:D-sedoheptulose-7-phosphate isomerase [Demetria terragena]|uniref:D-sedoheptulose-7-phosphate isomerase n=1 Tax=Demetria terragena TaxID=63959 RepID=UPI000381B793|nr:SIS domain-containing protein [Demetria terragena]
MADQGITAGAGRPAFLDPASHDAVVESLSQRQADGIAAWAALSAAIAEPVMTERVARAGHALVSSLAAGGTLLVCGNGGSASIASHFAAELVGKCIHDRAPLPAINLAESPTVMTAIANDYGHDQTFARGVAAHGRPGDVLVAMSTSGRSRNVLEGLSQARAHGVTTVLMTGAAGEQMHDSADHLLAVPSQDTPRIQEVHLLWMHVWCEAIDVLGYGTS